MPDKNTPPGLDRAGAGPALAALLELLRQAICLLNPIGGDCER